MRRSITYVQATIIVWRRSNEVAIGHRLMSLGMRITSNENKMSDHRRERAWAAVNGL